MGWTSYYVGSGCNRKDECMKYIDGYRINGKPTVTLIKSVMKGTTFYALLETVEKKEQFILCLLTSIDKGEFYYKDIQCNPYESGVPMSLVKLFKPSNDKDKEWKERLLAENKKAEKKLSYDYNTILKCKSNSSIDWNYKTIAKGEEFYIKVEVLNPYAKKKTKMYRVVNKVNIIDVAKGFGSTLTDAELIANNGGSEWKYHSTNYRLSSRTFKNVEVLEIVKR